MYDETFMNLVKEHDGFEMVIGFKDWVDHYIGGTGNKYWYLIMDEKKNSEYYIGTYEDGNWTDVFYKAKSNKVLSKETVEPGTTIKMITDRVYLYKDKSDVRKPQTVIEKEEDNYKHYVFGFGEKAWEVSEKYGVTTMFNDINHEELSFRLRDISLGKDVDKPSES